MLSWPLAGHLYLEHSGRHLSSEEARSDRAQLEGNGSSADKAGCTDNVRKRDSGQRHLCDLLRWSLQRQCLENRLHLKALLVP